MCAAKRFLPSGSSEQWLRHAESDLALARLAAGNRDILLEQVCFHAQQAIEKSLKALLVHLQISFPPVHDLEQLLEILREGGASLPAWADDLLGATPYAVETRYPGNWEPITDQERDTAMDLADRTLRWVRSAVDPSLSGNM